MPRSRRRCIGGSRLLLQLYPAAEVPQIQHQTIAVIDRRIKALVGRAFAV